MNDIKIEDLMKVNDIRERILSLIHTTDLGEDIIELMLLPIENVLKNNGVNLSDYDVTI